MQNRKRFSIITYERKKSFEVYFKNSVLSNELKKVELPSRNIAPDEGLMVFLFL